MDDGTQTPDALLNGGPGAAVELTETDLDRVAGGDKTATVATFGVSKDKQASANKNAEAVKALL